MPVDATDRAHKSLMVTVPWSAEQHAALVCFLENVTSPIPEVQRANILQLHRLAHQSGALLAVLKILCRGDGSYSQSVRSAAGLITKQLLQLNPSLIDEVDVVAVGEVLIGALADPISSVHVSVGLTVASIVRGEGFTQRWPAFSRMLREISQKTFDECRRGVSLDEESAAVRMLHGLATCIRIICEECSTELRELMQTDDPVSIFLKELLQQMLQSATVICRGGATGSKCVAAVLLTMKSCFSEGVFTLDDESDALEEEEEESAWSEGPSVSTAACNIRHHARQLHEETCGIVRHMCSCGVSPERDVLLAAVEYLNTTLETNMVDSVSTHSAVSALLPHVLHCVHSQEEESTAVICLDFISNLAVGSAETLKGVAREAADALFCCAALSSSVLSNVSAEKAERFPSNESSVRPVAPKHKQFIDTTEYSDGDEITREHGGSGFCEANISDDESSESSTALRAALSRVLDTMSSTCPDELIVHLIPLITSALTRAASSAESLKQQEGALFLLSELVDELFASLHESFLVHISSKCWATLNPNSTSPQQLRYQAVRCVTRMAAGWAVSERRTASLDESLSSPAVLRLLGVVASDASDEEVQREAICSIAKVTLHAVDSCNREGGAEVLASSLSGVIQGLICTLPSMQLAARTATYGSLSEVATVALGSKQEQLLIHDDTVMCVVNALGNRGYHLTQVLQQDGETHGSSNHAIELISLLNAMVEFVAGASRSVLKQVVAPLTSLARMFLNRYANAAEEVTATVEIHGADIATLFFDMLDNCCCSLVSDNELLRPTGESAENALLLQNVMLGTSHEAEQHVVELCARVLEGSHQQQSAEVELRRSGLAFLSSSLRFTDDPQIMSEMCRLCLAETQRVVSAEKVVSNALFCMGLIFFNILTSCNAESIRVLSETMPPCAVESFTGTLRNFITSPRVGNRKYVKVNAFTCAVAVAALQQMGHLHCGRAHDLLTVIISDSAVSMPQLKNHIEEQYRLLVMLSLIFSPEWGPATPAITQLVVTFTAAAPEELGRDIQRRWAPLVHMS
uniref:Uncharacterized protein n=1 Tax=Trypanosoma congolense (strain IL3000) TaxID=1068625 RepID=G0ULP5_TRYCI|nr:conserved hypothetical protein [Trypanosoma congolense IL3000]